MKPLNCNNCSACCKSDAVFLHFNDDPTEYEVETQNGRLMLAHKPNGDCIYLTDTGCGIYSKRPSSCRTFDCRLILEKFGEQQMIHMAQKGILQPKILPAALRHMDEI